MIEKYKIIFSWVKKLYLSILFILNIFYFSCTTCFNVKICSLFCRWDIISLKTKTLHALLNITLFMPEFNNFKWRIKIVFLWQTADTFVLFILGTSLKYNTLLCQTLKTDQSFIVIK